MFQYFNIFVSCLHIFTQAFTSNYSQAGPTDVTQPLELHPCDHLPQLLDLFQGNLSVVQRSGLRNGWMLKRLKNFEGSHSTNIIRHPPIWLKTTAKHFSMRWKVWAQVKACCLHGNPWEIHGKFMGNPWEIHGKSMGNPWNMLERFDIRSAALPASQQQTPPRGFAHHWPFVLALNDTMIVRHNI